MIFGVLNSTMFPCPRTHKLHVYKLAAGFVQNGYVFEEINSVDRLKYLGANDILYVSSHFAVDITHRFISGVLENMLHKVLSNTKCKLLFWNFHTTPCIDRWSEFSSRSLHLGEDMEDSYIDTEMVLVAFRRLYQVHKLKYSSPFLNSYAPLGKLQKIYDFQFAGSNYKSELTQFCNKNYKSFIRISPPIMDEIQRINSFGQSRVNLVFHSTANVNKGIIVERFPESISLGGVIAHDHPGISEKYGKVDSFFKVNTAEDLVEVHEFISRLSESDYANLREISYDVWDRSDLSYFDQAKKIILGIGG